MGFPFAPRPRQLRLCDRAKNSEQDDNVIKVFRTGYDDEMSIAVYAPCVTDDAAAAAAAAASAAAAGTIASSSDASPDADDGGDGSGEGSMVPLAKVESKVLGELAPNFENSRNEKATGKAARSSAF
ncbi:hypothetical protein V1478_002689 [Vespula squamosa]|uniref:Uncharacterized protein n=1 Tax=Vespula squamosa TaxID=30214 RepID=A0ABD2BTJ2_VESSQ